jgi:hypothetical protein
VGDEQRGEPLAHVRARPCRELGERFAAMLQEPHAHQLGVCARLGIAYASHKRWMAAEEPDADMAEYQAAVLVGLDNARVADLDDMAVKVEGAPGTHAGTIWNMRKFRHESRFKRFYDEPTKVELTGKDQGPLQVEGKPTREQALAELRELAKTDPEVAKLLKDAE